MATLVLVSALALLAALGVSGENDAVYYRRRDARRINRAVRGFEGASDGVASPAGGRPWTPGVLRARVTTAIPTGSWDSPSSAGYVQLRVKDAAGDMVDNGDPVRVWNDNTLASSLPVGRVCKVAWIAGDLWLVSASCS